MIYESLPTPKQGDSIAHWTPPPNPNPNPFFANFAESENDKWRDDLISYLNSPVPTSTEIDTPMGYGVLKLNQQGAWGVGNTGYDSGSGSINALNCQYFGGSVAHSSIQNSNAISYAAMGFPVSANGVQPSLQNNPGASSVLGSMCNAQMSNRGTFLQPQVHMPGRWASQLPVMDQSNAFMIPLLNSWESVQGGPFVSESWSGFGDNEARKRKYPFEPVNNGSWVGSGVGVMESEKKKYQLEAPSSYDTWVGSGSLMDVLTKSYMPLDLPPLEQWPSCSEDALGSDCNNIMAEHVMGNEESSQLSPNLTSGTLMDVYNSFIASSVSTKGTLSPKVKEVPLPPELSCEDKEMCGFNSALADSESVWESIQSMECEKTSTPVPAVDDNEPEIESVNIKKPSASLADSFTASQIKEHLSSFNHVQTGEITPSGSQNACQLCSKYKLLLTPTPVYCSSCDSRIKQNVKFYRSSDEENNTQHSICTGCFKGSRGSAIVTRGGSVFKANLHMATNNEEIEDSWVQCDRCQHWQHRICGLYNNETDLEGKAEYVCPKCCLKEIENGTRISLPKAVVGAKDLPRTSLSDHIEQRLFTRMKQEREETAKFLGIESEEVSVADGLVVRVVVSVDKELEVKKQFRDIFEGQDYPEKVEYRSKLILLFQKIGGVDICLFGMYVQEFGSECNGPNNRCVYISYIDSVKYFQPERKTASGEPLRTFVYHEILIGYLEHCKKRGFASCYIWSCPLIKGEDYIFYCHPKTQKTPEKTKLRQWYKLMIKKAVKDGIVVDKTNLFSEFFVSSNNKISAVRLPYFDGDCWSQAAENISKKLDDEESTGGRLGIKSRTKRILMANGQETPTKDALVMHKLGDIILPEKENYMIVRLHHVCTSCNEVILAGSRWFCNQCNKIQLCPRCVSPGRMHKCGSGKSTPLSEEVLSYIPIDTKEKDDVLVNKFLETRDDFLSKCQKSLYQFDTLGQAKYSSLMILYHFKQNLVVQPKGDTCHTRKFIPPSTEVVSEPRTEQPQNHNIVVQPKGDTCHTSMFIPEPRTEQPQNHNLVVQPRGDTCHTSKLVPPSTEVPSEPRKEQPQNHNLVFQPKGDTCHTRMFIPEPRLEQPQNHNLVVQPRGDTCHTRKLVPPSTEVASEPRKEQHQNHETKTLNRALDALIHASQCKSQAGCYPDCQTVKMLLRHASVCTTGRRNGCKSCKGAWWILNNHTNNCTEPNCSIPRCTDIRKKRAALVRDQIFAK